MPSNGSVLAALLRRNQRSIARDWAARMNVDARCPELGGLVRAEFTDRYLPAMLDIVAHLVERFSPELAAIYRDELQRYSLQLGHPLDLGRVDAFGFGVAELVAAQRTAISTGIGVSPILDVLDRLHMPLLTPPALRYDILLLGDCLMNGVRCFLTDRLRRKGIDLYGYHQYFSSALSSPFHLAAARELVARHPVGLIGFSPFTFDALPMFRQLLAHAPTCTRLAAAVDGVVDVVGCAVEEIRSWCDAPILLHNACGAPVGPDRASLTSLPPLTPARHALIEALNTALQERIPSWPGVLPIDEAAIAAPVGLRAMSAPAVPGIVVPDPLHHTSRLGRELARPYADIVETAATTARLRALAVDFDGTLWSGVMAEGAVTQHRDRQALLRRLAHQGTCLIGLSRGTAESIRWTETELASDEFVIVKRSWQPKSISLAEALQAVDIRPEHVGVIDDSPSERAMLAAAFPDLTLFDADDPNTWRKLALAADLATVTTDGMRRTERYRTALRRKDFVSVRTRAQATVAGTATAMAALELKLACWPMRPADVPRTLELLRRTNQFNTTGFLVSKQALAWMIDPRADHVVHVARLRDRFGEFGLVAAVIVHRARRSIESFVLSCRAMGYGVEQVLLDRMIAEHGTPIEARLVQTRLNEPCHGVYAAAGFRQRAPGCWRLDKRQPVRVPAWVAVETVNHNGGDVDDGRGGGTA